MKRKHVSILSYYTPCSVGSTESEHVAINDNLPFHTAPEIEVESESQPEHEEAEPEHEAEPQPQHEPDPQIVQSNATFDESTNQPRQLIEEFHPSQIIHDPGLRIPIEDYAPKIRRDVRRAYFLNGRNKAIGHKFKKTKDGIILISFQDHWLETFDWLEYSVQKDAAFCFYCYLFN